MSTNFVSDLDILFKDLFNSTATFSPAAKYNYPVDIFETESGLQIDIAAIGVQSEEIDLQIEDVDVLKVSCNRNQEDRSFIHRGIARRSFSLGWKISAKYDLSNLDATLNGGLLSIKVPFSEKSAPKKIEIKTI
jgi:HSP20 family protein